MIIDNFYIDRVAMLPGEADSPLVVHANAELPLAIPLEPFEAIAGWNPQIVEHFRRIEN